jgi:hypothetical protein
MEMEEDSIFTIKRFSQWLQARIFTPQGLFWPPSLTKIARIEICMYRANRGNQTDENDVIAKFNYYNVLPTNIPSTSLDHSKTDALTYQFGFIAEYYEVEYMNNQKYARDYVAKTEVK